jgi:hypothetical protein
MRRLIILFIFFYLLINVSNAQFLSYSSDIKNNSISIGYYNNYFRFNDSKKDISETEIISFKKAIPYVSYETDNLMLTVAYNKFKYHEENTSVTVLDGYYKLFFPIGRQDVIALSIPALLRTSYWKMTQNKGNIYDRIELGNIGIGSGLQINKSFDWIGFNFIYDFCINYSTVNFSIDYGYSVQNEIILSLDFNQLFDSYGITIGGKYFDQKWKISDKKYNYYTSGFGGFIGINF